MSQDLAGAQRFNVLLVYVFGCLTTASHGGTELAFPLNLDRLGYPLPSIGAAVALMGFGSLASRIPGGVWYRLAWARWLNAGALALMALTSIALGPLDPWPLQAALGTLHGFAFGLATTFALAYLIEIDPREGNVAATMAWYTGAVSAGYAIGAPLASEAIVHGGHAAAFAVSGLVGILGAAVTLGLRPLPAPEAARDRVAENALALARGCRGLAGLPGGVWLATLVVFYLNFLGDTYNAFFPIYAVGVGIPLVTVGALKSVNSLAGTAIRFAAAGLFRFVSPVVVNHGSIVTVAAGFIALAATTNEALLFVVLVVMGAARGLLRVTSTTAVAEERRRPGVNVGLASGVFNGGLDAGTMLGPPVSGALAGLVGIPMTFRIIAVALPSLYYAVLLAQRLRPARTAVDLGQAS